MTSLPETCDERGDGDGRCKRGASTRRAVLQARGEAQRYVEEGAVGEARRSQEMSGEAFRGEALPHREAIRFALQDRGEALMVEGYGAS